VGADSRLIRSALARLALLAEGPITAATVRAGVVAEALDALALVKAALAGERALALRAAAAVRQRRVKVGDLLLVAQQEALQQMVLVETLGSSEQQVMQILGWRSSKRVYHARRELSLDGSLPQAMLTAAMAMAALIGRGVPLTPQQVVSRLLATCFSGAA
jgi:DNA polymerase III delta subunit